MDKENLNRLIEEFDHKVPQIEKERQGLYDLRDEFVKYFNKEKLASMTLEEYCGGLGTDIRNFNHGLWRDLIDLSLDIVCERDQSNRVDVCGISVKDDNQYKRAKKDENKDVHEVFESIKKELVKLYDAGKEHDWAKINKCACHKRLIRKFLSTYFPNKYIGLCNEAGLKKYVEYLGIETKNAADLGESLLQYKAQIPKMEKWSVDIYSYFLCKVLNSDYIQCIYFGTPGSGKSYKVDKEILGGVDKKQIFRTTFHPDTDYASFVGTYKPTMNDHHEIEYQFVPQVFTKAYIAAWNNPTVPIYLVIEEINRGNCAQIFGDLFQLLDRDKDGKSEYPIDADVDLCKYLKASLKSKGSEGIEDGKLCLPSNLSILATMNTSDQSLFPMDSAFKRRWDWEFVPSHSDDSNNFNINLGDKTYKWHDFLAQINKRIKEATDSEDKQLGTYFIKGDVNAKQFKSKVMFYLWSEICKEEYGTTHNFFRRKTEKDELEFSFNDLYDNGADDASILIEFMDYLEVPVYSASASEE